MASSDKRKGDRHVNRHRVRPIDHKPADRKADRHSKRRTQPPFRGVDGEGADRYYVNTDGECIVRHEYLLLRAGTDLVLETGYPLTTLECLAFLADLPPDSTHVGYFFNYDVTKILSGTHLEPGIPDGRLQRLLDRDSREIVRDGKKTGQMYPVDIYGGTYQIDYLPNKEFSVRRRNNVTLEYGPWIRISDVGTLFQCSFVAALKQWLGDEPGVEPVIAAIAEGKDKRSNFGTLTEYERRYNLLEIIMLERLMSKFRDTCHECEIRPAKWQGPGNLAAALFKREGLPRRAFHLEDAKPGDITIQFEIPELIQLANASYYGGRFEPNMIGDIPGPIYYADLNSAYASIYPTLPCLLHGRWETCTKQPGSGLYIGDVTFDHRPCPSTALYTLPFRTPHGTIVFPSMGRGIYTSPELALTRDHGGRVHWHHGYRYHPDCDCQHFDFAEQIYNERKRLGKTGKGMALKIVLASCYGKLAQSIGRPVYSNPIWATLITSTVRAILTRMALQQHNGEDVVMLATDGLATLNPRRADYGPNLGQWDSQTHHNGIFMIQSGLYIMGDQAPKTRGVPQRKIIGAEHEFRAAWAAYNPHRDPTPPSVTVTMNNFIGLRLAAHRGNPRTAGTWIRDDPKEVTFNWATKRVMVEWDGRVVYTRGYNGSLGETSAPYKRNIGGMLEHDRLKAEDQPDWGDTL